MKTWISGILLLAVCAPLSGTSPSRADAAVESARKALPRYRLPSVREERAKIDKKIYTRFFDDLLKLIFRSPSPRPYRETGPYLFEVVQLMLENIGMLELEPEIPVASETRELKRVLTRLKTALDCRLITPCASSEDPKALEAEIRRHIDRIYDGAIKNGEKIAQDPERFHDLELFDQIYSPTAEEVNNILNLGDSEISAARRD